MKTIFTILKRNFIALPLYIWQLLFFIIPLCLLTYRGWNDSTTLLETFLWLYNNNFISIMMRSFLIALCVSYVCIFIGYLFSYIMTYLNGFLKMFFLLTASVPFLSNFIIHIASWISFLENKNGLYSFLLYSQLINNKITLLYNNIAVGVVLTYCYLPYAILPLYLALEKFDKRLLSAAYDLGATGKQSFFKIVIPSTEKAIYTGFFLVFIPASTEFVIYELIGGSRYLSCGTLFSYIALSPTLLHITPLLTFIYVGLLIGFCLIGISILKYILFKRDN